MGSKNGTPPFLAWNESFSRRSATLPLPTSASRISQSVRSIFVTVSESDRSCTTDLICRFQRAFDQHDWDDLETCLTPQLWIDYGDLRGSPPEQESASRYCELRRDSLDHLDLQHNHSNLVIFETDEPGQLRAQCNFQILRFERSGPRHFHTYGTCEFRLKRDPLGDLRIFSVQQRVTRNSGDPEIHLRANPE